VEIVDPPHGFDGSDPPQVALCGEQVRMPQDPFHHDLKTFSAQ
jgi:hypothetical protein